MGKVTGGGVCVCVYVCVCVQLLNGIYFNCLEIIRLSNFIIHLAFLFAVAGPVTSFISNHFIVIPLVFLGILFQKS